MAKTKSVAKKTNQPVGMAPQSLKGKSTAELDRFFDELPSPEAVGIHGVYRGDILTGGIFDLMPGPAATIAKQVAAQFWRAKSFSGDAGVNVWFRPDSNIRFAPYKIDIRPIHTGGGNVIAIDYDIPQNPGPVKNILGEARQIGPDTYLARMLYRFGGSARLITYFTLQK